MNVMFLGSGDAFGSGQRFQSCILVEQAENDILLDCGSSSMIAMSKFNVNPNRIGLILITNLHGDHFGGIPYYIVDAQLNRRRNNGLVIAGPIGIKTRFPELMEATFPGSSKMKTKFALNIVELDVGIQWEYRGTSIQPFSVPHAEGDPHIAFRLAFDDKVLAYSGDTEWSESLIPVAQGADLFIVESYFYDKKVPYHLDYHTLCANRNYLNAKNIVLTHMSNSMLAKMHDVVLNCAEDGKIFVF